MTTQERIKDAFDAALDCPPNQRERLLVELCADDDFVRAEVEALLNAHAESDGFLSDSPLDKLAFDRISTLDLTGRRIGVYELQSEIGQGGMATVYLAERMDGEFRQQVALKIVWPGANAEEITRRFKQERQILASLDHPNIARLLDGGTTEKGWPYLVMEYIAGQPITRYCRDRKLPLAERLRLFQSVCAAVAYAHRNLVIHRDIKPSNILVTEDGTVKLPKLLDFGIAKLLAPDSANETQPTITGLRPMTPEYASPEQLREETITTATDVYSLGVLLYELLAGAHPFDLKNLPLHELIRIVCEEDPPPPSTLGKETRSDLDNIALKALHKDPRQRYQTVEQFSDDISRHLDGKTVIARPATLFYRAGKFIKRHKAQLAVVLVMTLALVGFLAREVQLRRRAEDQNLKQRRQLYSAQMQQALQNWQDGNLARMRETLTAWQPQSGTEELRGFEWRYLWRLLNSESLNIELQGGIRTMALSPDGKVIGTGMDNRAAVLCDSQTGQQIASLSGHNELIRGIAFSPDGKLLATCDAMGITRIWEIAGRREILQVGGHGKNIVHAVAFSPDSQTFATAGRDGVAKLWNSATGKELVAFKSDSAGVRAIVFSPDGRTIFTGSDDAVIRCLEVATGRERKVLKGFPVDIVSLVMTPDGKHLVASGSDPEIKMWDLATGKIIRTFTGHTDYVWKIAVSPDGKTLASGSVDRTARLWEIASGREIDRIKGHNLEVSFLAFTTDGRRLITGDHKQLKLWEMNNLPQSRILRVPSQCKIEAISLSADGKWLVTGESVSGGSCQPPAKISIWEVASAKVRLAVPVEGSITGLSFLPLRSLLAYSDRSGLAGILDTESGGKVGQFTGYQTMSVLRKGVGSIAAISSLDVAPDGRLIATGGDKNMVKLWTPDGREVRMLRGPGGATEADGHSAHAIAFSHDGRKLAIGGFDPGVPIFDPASGQTLSRLAGHRGTILAIKFSPDDRMIATAGEDSLVKIWDTADGRLLQTFKRHGHYVNALAWTPDGQRLVSAGKDQTIRIWNVVLGMEVLTLNGHSDSVTSLAFSRDGRLMVSAGWDGIARLWRAATDAEVRAHTQK